MVSIFQLLSIKQQIMKFLLIFLKKYQLFSIIHHANLNLIFLNKIHIILHMNQVNHSIKQQIRDFIPFLIKLWIIFDCLVLYLDSFYLANRPQTLKGGNLYQYLFFYQFYVDMDPLYGNSPDKFCHLQGYLSGIEATLGFIFLFLNMSQGMRIICATMTIAVQAFTCWKTVIYIWYSFYFAVPDVINFTTKGIFLYWVPDLIWVIMPLLSIFIIGRQMSKYLTSIPAQKLKKA